MTPLQQELRDMERRVHAECDAALKHLTGRYDRACCREAYHRIWRAESDMIGQRHGLEPMLWQENPPTISETVLVQFRAEAR